VLQVKQALGQGKPLSQQMLLQLEVHMLLTLLVLQLTAALPAKHRAVLTAHLRLSMLHDIQITFSGLHSVPLAAAYTGPQLALQVWPTPAGVGVQRQQEQQQPPQTESMQPPVTCVLAPTAALLAEMLPLLTKYCLTALKGLQHEQQQHQYHQQQQQQQQQQGSASQQAGGGSAPASTSGTAAAELSDYSNPSKPIYMGHTRMSLMACVDSLAILLCDLVVPEQTGGAPTTEVPMAEASVPTLAAAAAASSDSAPAVPEASCSYVLHAHETIMLHAVDILRVLEWVLRDTAARGGSLAGLLPTVAAEVSALCSYGSGDGLYDHESVLVMLALAAGPGSRVQRQLYSLLCTLFQVIPALPQNSEHATVVRQLCETASGAAEALLDGAAAKEQQQQHAGDSATAAAAIGLDPAAAVAMLPSLFILGRFCLYNAGLMQGVILVPIQEQPQPGSTAQEQPQPGSSAQEQPQPGSSAQEQPQPASGSSVKEQHKTSFWHITFGPVLEWLQAGSTSEQLAAAGYRPLSILQQLGQVVESSEAVFTITHSMQADEATILAAVQQYRATGLALCSFAVSCVCNNPGCFNMSGPSALHLVSGCSCLCGGCRTARFCSHTCLRACWKQHKPVCEALAAAAATAAAVTAATGGSAAAP
jgi:hypothetical protein